MKLKGKVAIITGGGSGIGRAAAVKLAQEGASVLATDVNLGAVQAVAEQARAEGRQCVALALDVTSEVSWAECVAHAEKQFGRLDVLVASAGISHAAPVAEMSFADWQKVIAINLNGVFLGVRAAAPLMRKSGGGSIAIVSSASGIKAAPGASAYSASKAALRGFAKSVAVELAGHEIRVNTVFPGAVKTPMWNAMPFFRDLVKDQGEEAAWKAIASQTPLGRLCEPEEITEAILYLASDESKFVTGAELVIDGGYTA